MHQYIHELINVGGKKGFMTNVTGRKGVPSGTKIKDGTSVGNKNSLNKMHNTSTLLDCEIG